LSPFLSRRILLTGLACSAVGTVRNPLLAASAHKYNLHVGHTGITWRNDQVQDAIPSIASLGFYGFETFNEVMAKWDEKGGLLPLLQAKKLALISGYCTVNLTDGAKRSEEMEKAKKWCSLIKQNGGRILVIGPNQVKRESYDFAANKANIVLTLNELAKLVEQQGLTPVLHQHTGTCVESRDETYSVLESADTRHLKFGPDVGQLTKGGQDAVKVVTDFLPIVQHMHLKDYNGQDDHLLGYCPLGKGKVDVPAILKLMDGRKINGMVMVELDNDWKDMSPTPPAELAKESRDYLRTLGVSFKV
jgi:inosose dehydratase